MPKAGHHLTEVEIGPPTVIKMWILKMREYTIFLSQVH